MSTNLFAQSPGGVTPTAWFKADGTMTLSGSDVTQWNNDVVGATVHLDTKADGTSLRSIKASNWPTFSSSGLNFNPVVTFDGTQGICNLNALGSAYIDNNNNSIFVVFSNAAATGDPGVMFKWEKISTNRISFEINSDNTLRCDFPTSSYQNKSSSTVLTNAYLGTGLTNSLGDSLFINGVSEAVLTFAPATPSADKTQTGKLLVGSNADGAYPFSGYLAEAVLI